MKGYVYCLYDEPNKICRIGMSTVNNDSRVKTQLGYYPYKLLVTKVHVDDPLFAEGYLHQLFRTLKTNGSWYTITPDMFKKYMNEYLEQNRLEVMKWTTDEIKRGVKVWQITVNDKTHIVEMVCAYPSSKKCLLKKDGKDFYAVFKNHLGYFTAKNAQEVPVTIINKSKTQKIKASIALKYVENADPIVVEFMKNFKKADRHEKFLREQYEKFAGKKAVFENIIK